VKRALALALLSACTHGESEDAQQVWMSRPAPQIEGRAVVSGKPFALSEQRGHVVVLAFGYTACKQACPMTMQRLGRLHRAFGDRVQLVYATIDPDRDGPEKLSSFVAPFGVEGLIISSERIDEVTRELGVEPRKRLPNSSGAYAMDHSAALWVVDREGRLRVRFREDASDEIVRAAIESLVST
jgi:protein SCO1/2